MARFSDYIPIFQINMYDIISLIMKNKAVQQSIIDYNQEQLSQGVDANNKVIFTALSKEQNFGYVYAKNTIFGTPQYAGKIHKSQPWHVVTLKDTGKFYKTFNVKVNSDSVEVLADFNKDGESILDNFDDDFDFLGLIDENKTGFVIWVLSDYLELELKRHFKLS